MNIIQVYAVVADDILFAFFLINLLSYLASLWKHISLFTLKHLIYLYFLYRHRFIDSYSRAELLTQAIYLTANLFYLSFRVSSATKTNIRVETLSLVNMISLFTSPSLSFLIDRLGVFLQIYRCAYHSVDFITITLVLIHVLFVVSQESFLLSSPQHLFAVIVSSLTYSFFFIANHS